MEEGHPFDRVQEPLHKLSPARVAGTATQHPFLPHLFRHLGVVVQPGGKDVQENLEYHLRLHKQPIFGALLEMVEYFQLVEAEAYVPAKVRTVAVMHHVPDPARVLGQVLL